MVEAELVVNALTLVVIAVVLIFVGIAYARTRIRRLLVLFLLAALIGVNMVVATVEDFLAQAIPYIELFSSLLALGISLLLLATVVRQFRWEA